MTFPTPVGPIHRVARPGLRRGRHLGRDQRHPLRSAMVPSSRGAFRTARISSHGAEPTSWPVGGARISSRHDPVHAEGASHRRDVGCVVGRAIYGADPRQDPAGRRSTSVAPSPARSLTWRSPSSRAARANRGIRCCFPGDEDRSPPRCGATRRQWLRCRARAARVAASPVARSAYERSVPAPR